MALNPNESASYGMFKAVRDGESIFGNTNKTNRPLQQALIDEVDEYESSMSDEEILNLTDQWQRTYEPYYATIKPTQKKAFHYWIGKQVGEDMNARSTTSDPNPLVDNVIFTAVETFLPLATRANPDPVVSADPSDIGQKLKQAIQVALVHLADKIAFKRKLARLVRRWAWDRLGVVKISWDYVLKEIKTDVKCAKNFVFDKDGYVDEKGYFKGEYIGEKKKETASILMEMFPKKKGYILAKCEGKLATKLDYIEWWYKGKDVFFTLDNEIVLGKFKNPNWNYDTEIRKSKPEQGEAQLPTEEDYEQSEQEEEVEIRKGINFHKEPMAPYVFFSVFSSGTQPYDETSLILQNTQLQDIVNRRLRQIDKNVDQMNNGMLLSGESFDSDQASNAANALAKGQAILVPNGDVNKAAARFNPGNMPEIVYRQLEDMRGEIMNIYGTSGSTPQGLQDQKSVRGKIMVSQTDTSRIGGTITEQLEQIADTIYNFWVQMMFVYYDDEQFFVASGSQGGQEIISIKNTMFPLTQTLDITVKEGSLIPKDPLTQRNEAMDLWSANAIDPLNFFKRLDVPDPVDQTQSLILWQLLQKGAIPPQAYLPSFQVPAQSNLPTTQPETGGPAVNPTTPAQNLAPQTPMPTSPPAVEAQESALIKSMPL